MFKFVESMKKMGREKFKLEIKKEDSFNLPHGEILLQNMRTGELTSLANNIPTKGASVLLARLVKDNTEPAGGFTWFAVGSGAVGEDPFNPPAPEDTQETLFTEIDRVEPTSIDFIDPGTGAVSLVATNILDFKFDFEAGRGVGRLTECGIFGGEASSTPNSGTLCTYKRFSVKTKEIEDVFRFIYRITF